MGDSSDNIPGVPGIGEKTAFKLVTTYGDLDSVYNAIEQIEPSVRKKLEAGRDSAYLSRTLATIDRSVPLEVPENAGKIEMPFSEDVRTQFLQLEFTSLLKMDIFVQDKTPAIQSDTSEKVPLIHVQGRDDFFERFGHPDRFAVTNEGDDFYFFANGKELVVSISHTLLNEGVTAAEAIQIFQEVFARREGTVLLYGKKDFRHLLRKMDVELLCAAEDVSLLKYLTDFSGKDDKLLNSLQEYGLNEDTPAYGVWKLYELLNEKLNREGLRALYDDVELPLADVLYDMEVSLSLIHI